MANTSKYPTNTDEVLDGIFTIKRAPIAGFIALLLLYILGIYFVNVTTISEDVTFLFGTPVPLRSTTGFFSAVANACIMLMVVLYKKPGFVVSLILLLLQFPMLIYRLFIQGNGGSISGFGTSVMMLIAIIILHLYNTNTKKYQEKLLKQAITDRLTGLPNRFACTELMTDLEEAGERHVIALLDLKNIRNINNTMGQHTVDDLLIEVARRWKDIAVQGSSGTRDFIVRQGGNEFALIMRDFNSGEDIIASLRSYEDALKSKITVDDCDYVLSVNMGYAEFPVDANDRETLLACASSALVAAKRYSNSDTNIRHYTPDLMNAKHIVEMERKIRTALETDALFFMLQPQFDIDHRLIGFETLARIKDTDGTILNPSGFIPVAEKVGLVDAIDFKVFKESAVFIGDLIRRTGADIKLSANISVKHLMKNNFIDEMKEILEACGMPAIQLEIEITESIMIDSIERAFERIEEVKQLGVKIAIDDFGTGYSSLSYLTSFPADLLKIDKSFIDRMNENEASREYVATIINIGHVMDFEVISEGVEQPEQLDTLRSIGCDYIQGFVWGKPMSPEEAEDLVMSSFE